MYLLLQIILLGAAVGSANPVAIPPRQHHDATEFNHNILDHGYINDKVTPELEAKCNISALCTCLKREEMGCEKVMDLTGECPNDVKGFIGGMLPYEYCDGFGGPGDGGKLIRREPDPPGWLRLEFDKCNISSYCTCLKRDHSGCDLEAVMDRTGECKEYVKRIIRGMIPHEYCPGGSLFPGGGNKLIRRDPDPPGWLRPENKCNISSYCTCMERGHSGCDLQAVMDQTDECSEDTKRLMRGMFPHEICRNLVVEQGEDKLIRRGPDQPLDEVELLGLGGAAVIDDIPTMVHKGPEVLVTSRTPQCLKECLTGPADGPDENRERAECVNRCIEEYPDEHRCTKEYPHCEDD